jgi:hypothetical protein
LELLLRPAHVPTHVAIRERLSPFALRQEPSIRERLIDYKYLQL